MPSLDVSVYRALDQAFSELGARWYVFGAQAAVLHGAARFTEDLDVTVDPGAHAPDVIAAALGRAGFVLRVQDEDFVRRTRVLPMVHGATGLPVDVVLAGPGLEERFFERAVMFTVEGASVPVAAVDDLVAMKLLAGRTKDVEDVVSLLAVRADVDLVRARDTLRVLEAALDRSDLLPELEQCLVRGRPR